MRLFTRETELNITPPLALEEGRMYRLVFAPQAFPLRVMWGVKELTWSQEQGGFLFQTHFEAGSNSLHVYFSDREEQHYPAEIKPNPDKLSAAAWEAMLSEIEEALPGSSVGISHGQQGSVGREGTLLPMLASALLPLVPLFVRVVEAIIHNPRMTIVQQSEEIRLHTIQRADRETLRWVARHPSMMAALDAWSVARLGHTDPFLPQLRSQETHAHPANQYALWLIIRVRESLQSLAERLQKAARRFDTTPESREWCELHASALENHARLLDRLQRRSFFRGLVAMPPSDAALLVVQDEPNYARAHALARRLLSPRFRLPPEPDEPSAPLKPTYSLYELWAFLAVKKALERELPTHQWSWSQDAAEKLLFGTGHGVFARATHEDEALTLWFNLTFRGWHSYRGERYSISLERRPDIVLTYQRGAQSSWMFFDAKYRVHRRALGESFESVHLYRDSLRWGGFGGVSRGGLLLSPREHNESTSWFSEEFRERFGVGVVALTPGNPAAPFTSWVLEVLKK